MDRSIPTAVAAGVALVPGLATLYLAFNGGGYFAAPTGVLAAALLGLVALLAAWPGSPWRGWGRAVAAAAVPLALLALWALLSGSWSGSSARAAVEADRVVLYLAALLLMASVGWSGARVRLLVGGLAAAVVAVAAAALARHLLLGDATATTALHTERLSYPVSYWNALGLLAGVGIVLCLHLASSLREPLWVRAAGAAGLPVLASALLLTLSRGALWCTALGLVVFLVASRPRGLPGACVAALPFTFLALLGLDHGAVAATPPEQIDAFGLGSQPAWVIGFSAVAAALARIACAPLDRTLPQLSLDARLARRVAIGGACALVAGVAVAGLVVHRTGLGNHAYAAFVSSSEAEGTSRLTSLSNNNRVSKWRIGYEEWQRHPFEGTGAGTFALSWQRERPSDGHVRDAHSLYPELLGELGLPGLVALVAALAAVLAGLANRSRGPDRAAPAALLGAGIAWAVHAGVDWDWEMPVVTLWLFAAGGMALARTDLASGPAHPRLRWAGRAGVAVACVLLAALLPVRVALSDARLQRSLAGLAAGDCRNASIDARSALAVMAARWQADYVLGVCAAADGRWGEAEDAMRAAAAGDRRNWLPRYGTAVALTALGKDGSGELRIARRLNPREPVLRESVVAAKGRTLAERRRAAHTAPLPLPEL
ncbi:MAG TPA: O-antigen ligase family protein [Solirubrobacteraceae bacterium]|nr:O-antigen ligase family protein [Solirubrobacteraceae bacterium]